MRAVVTGGAGFIGSHLVDQLLAAGWEVLVIDDLSSGRRENLAAAEAVGDVRFERLDICAGDAVGDLIAEYRPELIFHLAAQADVRRSLVDPVRDAQTNVLGTINVLEASRACGSVPVVFSSTGGAIYGEGSAAEIPFAESRATHPGSAYGVSKLAAESYCDLYRRLHGIPVARMRLANVYGPRQDPGGEAGVVAIFAGKLLAGERPTVYGDGHQTRDYIYVADVCAALAAAGSALVSGPDQIADPLNVGTGRQTSVLELLGLLGGLVPGSPEPDFAPRRTGELEHNAVDPARAASTLGWRPQTALRDGLAVTLAAAAG